MTTLNICAYCQSMGDNSEKPVVLWEETGELVCLDCRVGFVEAEFAKPNKEIPEDILDMIQRGMLF
ncbi:MAG TPA: hypothetical protein VF941_11880 [Clostridia bacterium]